MNCNFGCRCGFFGIGVGPLPQALCEMRCKENQCCQWNGEHTCGNCR